MVAPGLYFESAVMGFLGGEGSHTRTHDLLSTCDKVERICIMCTIGHFQ